MTYLALLALISSMAHAASGWVNVSPTAVENLDGSIVALDLAGACDYATAHTVVPESGVIQEYGVDWGLAEDLGMDIVEVSDEDLEKIAGGEHNGVFINAPPEFVNTPGGYVVLVDLRGVSVERDRAVVVVDYPEIDNWWPRTDWYADPDDAYPEPDEWYGEPDNWWPSSDRYPEPDDWYSASPILIVVDRDTHISGPIVEFVWGEGLGDGYDLDELVEAEGYVSWLVRVVKD